MLCPCPCAHASMLLLDYVLDLIVKAPHEPVCEDTRVDVPCGHNLTRDKVKVLGVHVLVIVTLRTGHGS